MQRVSKTILPGLSRFRPGGGFSVRADTTKRETNRERIISNSNVHTEQKNMLWGLLNIENNIYVSHTTTVHVQVHKFCIIVLETYRPGSSALCPRIVFDCYDI